EGPLRMALMPTLVTREVFPRAVTIAATNQALAFATGPAACGWVIAAADVGAVYAVDAALVATSLLTLVFLRTSGGQPSERRTPRLLAVREGLAFLRGSQVVRGGMTRHLLAVIFGGAGALLPIYATEILHVGPKGYGMLSSSFEAGALAMSLVLTTLPPITRSGRALLGTVAIYGLATIVFGVSRW